MKTEIKAFNDEQEAAYQQVCDLLAKTIDECLPEAESKIWHRHPVWFLDNNPTVGYSILKAGVRLMFWSGASFDEEKLKPGTGKFKDASCFYQTVEEVNMEDLKRWIDKSKLTQWDYKNIYKRKGKLERLK